ncbi:caspase family protein [Streptomyces sp. MAR4 CNY-716]
MIAQPGSAAQVLDTVRERARRARDTLLVYYAGHGLTGPHTDELYLALPDSDREREYTSLRYEYLCRAVLDVRASAQRTVVILDCCYSGRALLGGMSASVHIADQAIVEGTCLLTASAETRSALSPPGETYTAFTGELITTLTEGIPGKPDPLDMDTLYRHLHRRLASQSRPLPQQRSRNTGGLIGIARNRAAAARGVRPGSPSARESDEAGAASREWETARRLSDAVAASADPDFEPFWFAVPATRQFFSVDGSGPATELAPGIWYLAVGQRGETIVAQTNDGRRGLLRDTRGIQRG